VVMDYGTAPQARRSELYLQHILQRYGAEPRCKNPLPTAAPIPGPGPLPLPPGIRPRG